MRYNAESSCSGPVTLQSAEVVNWRLQYERTFKDKNTSLLRTGLIVLGFLALVLLSHPGNARAACQVQYTGEAAKMFGSAPRGNFNSRAACENYIANSPYREKINSHCVGSCDGTSGSSSGGYSGGSPSQQMAVGLFGSLLQGFMQKMLAPAPPSTMQEYRQEESPQEKLKREQEQKQRWEEYYAKVKEQIAMSEKEYGRLKREEFEKEHNLLVSDLKSRYAATFGSEGKTGNALRQLQCSAYWALKAAAEMTAPRGDTELARLYGEYSAQAKKGILTSECPEMNVNVPDVPAPQPAGGLQQEFYVFLLEETNQIIPVISNLKERKKVSQNIITLKQSEIETLRKKQDTSDDKGKQEIDTLLQEANKLLAEAMEEDKKATEELNMAENKLKALQEMNKIYTVEKNPNKKEVK